MKVKASHTVLELKLQKFKNAILKLFKKKTLFQQYTVLLLQFLFNQRSVDIYRCISVIHHPAHKT